MFDIVICVKRTVLTQLLARDRQLDVCATVTTEQLLCPLGSSFPSLRDTLVRLLAVEWLWLERWRERSARVLGAGRVSNLGGRSREMGNRIDESVLHNSRK